MTGDDWPRGDMFAGEDAETSIGLAIGAASMCWDPTPAGVFDSTAASEIVDQLLDHLRQLRLLP